ncbi:MAG: cytochrome c peroxidase [Saprospiraceae bacterium]
MKNINLFYLAALAMFSFASCVQDDVKIQSYHYSEEQFKVISEHLNLPADPIDYSVELPIHILNSGATTAPVDNDKATLGRVLFYDNNLSGNNKVSCASCHDQSLAFADGKAKSEGFDGQLTKRNSLALGSVVSFSATYQGGNTNSFASNNGARFFWDERAGSVAEQSTLTIQDDIEMGMDLDKLPAKLKSIDYYKVLFETAFPDEEINKENILAALSEFINAMGSFESKFDVEAANSGGNFGNIQNQDFNGFTVEENKGKQLYNDNCASCHGVNFASPGVLVANNGLDMVYEDKGVGGVSNQSIEEGLFKVPSLRNIALTGPYMHDGRFETLEDVIEHYSSNIKNHKNLSFQLKEFDQNGSNQIAKKFNFSEEDKTALVAFLNTLTDQKFIAAEKFADPFK